jgi:hypothetical protein
MSLIFICGAVGSGNSFLYEIITEDPNVYGLNEDAFGGTLNRLVVSENETGKCPHAIKAFKYFIKELQADREHLVLKTPANLLHIDLILEHFPEAKFICTLREPYAAIVSGLVRHGKSVDIVAKAWRDDALRIKNSPNNYPVIPFELLTSNPSQVIDELNESTLPLGERSHKYSAVKLKVDRQDPKRWEKKVDAETRDTIYRVVKELDLLSLHEELKGSSKLRVAENMETSNNKSNFMTKVRHPITFANIVIDKIKRKLKSL